MASPNSEATNPPKKKNLLEKIDEKSDKFLNKLDDKIDGICKKHKLINKLQNKLCEDKLNTEERIRRREEHLRFLEAMGHAGAAAAEAGALSASCGGGGGSGCGGGGGGGG